MFYGWRAVMDRYWLFKKENEKESCLSFMRAAGKKERSSAYCEVMNQLKTDGFELVVRQLVVRPASVVLC